MWSTRKRKSGSRLGNDKRGLPAFDTRCLTSLKFGKPTTKLLQHHYNRLKRIALWVYNIEKALETTPLVAQK